MGEKKKSWASPHTPVIPAFGRQRQEIGHSSRPAGDIKKIPRYSEVYDEALFKKKKTHPQVHK